MFQSIPEEPFRVAAEALFAAGSRSGISTRFLGEFPYVVIESNNGKEVWSADSLTKTMMIQEMC